MSTTRTLCACLLAWATAAPAVAQDAAAYSGTWSVGFEAERSGRAVDATLVLAGDSGTWKAIAYSKRDACIGLESPVAVKEASAESISIEVYRSKALTGCKDWKVRLNRVDEQTLSGTFGDGRVVTLKRTP